MGQFYLQHCFSLLHACRNIRLALGEIEGNSAMVHILVQLQTIQCKEDRRRVTINSIRIFIGKNTNFKVPLGLIYLGIKIQMPCGQAGICGLVGKELLIH